MARTMRKFPIKDLTTPKRGMFQIHVDDWWAVSENEELYFFGENRSPYLSPQCNANEGLARKINEGRQRSLYEDYKETRQIPVVYVPINISDWVD